MLIFSEKGWDIERETFAEELFQRFCKDMETKSASMIFEMKSVKQQVMMIPV